MQDPILEAIRQLDSAGVRMGPGLTETEFAHVEGRYGFRFCASHRRFLSLALPLEDQGERTAWPDWRGEPEEVLADRLAWPTDSIVYDVLNNAFWPSTWGARPDDVVSAEAHARWHLSRVPRMVPFFSHRYLPAAPAIDPPVYSIYQTDVIYYGDNLLDYVAHEFRAGPRQPGVVTRSRTPFWSDLAEGEDDILETF